ncbi:MAG TPA: hypothetical protein VKS60_10545 [Stellaceae bacterium]|nr:hypothetical protein [Stellaceae bacterium]
MMTLKEFEALLDRHGPDLERWPAPDRDAAAVLVADSVAAQAVFARHLSFDRLFELETVPEPPPAGRIVARALAAARRERPFAWLWPSGLHIGWKQAAALAACAVVGFIVGLSTETQSSLSPQLLDLIDGSSLEFSDE